MQSNEKNNIMNLYLGARGLGAKADPKAMAYGACLPWLSEVNIQPSFQVLLLIRYLYFVLNSEHILYSVSIHAFFDRIVPCGSTTRVKKEK